MNTREADAQAQAAAWNAKNAVGTPVRVRLDSGSIVHTVTRSAAEVLSGQRAMIWVEGMRGCCALCRCVPIEAACRVCGCSGCKGRAVAPPGARVMARLYGTPLANGELHMKAHIEEDHLVFETRLPLSGYLDLQGTGVTTLPEGLHVGGSLYLRGTGVTTLPEGLHAGASEWCVAMPMGGGVCVHARPHEPGTPRQLGGPGVVAWEWKGGTPGADCTESALCEAVGACRCIPLPEEATGAEASADEVEHVEVRA